MRFGLTLLLVGSLTHLAKGQRIQVSSIVSEQQTLKGFRAVSLAIDGSIPGYDFRGQIEGILQQGGLTILPASGGSPTYPILQLTVESTVLPRFRQVNYCATLTFLQLFRLADGRNIKATTWSSSHHGMAPWNGILSPDATVAEMQKQIRDLLGGFVNDWREMNVAGAARLQSGRFDGVWQGSYACSGSFGGGGRTQWTIREITPGNVEVEELWNHFTTGRNSYSGKISGSNLDVKTKDMGGYEVKLALSDDDANLRGVYVGHPNQCETITLQRMK